MPLMSVADVQAKVAAAGAVSDVLYVLCVLADWNPVCGRLEPHLQV